ncbi:MAG: histidine phosphatase family protein [Ilumatobacteraceae bacterium]
MTNLYFVRHGRAEAGWDAAMDPSLDDMGRRQAAAVADELASTLQPCTIFASPLARCRETAEFLAAKWSADTTVEPRIAEIPSPRGVAMADRMEWLRGVMQGAWADLAPEQRSYRDELVRFARETKGPAVLFSHFVAINALIGHVLGIDDVMTRSLDNCSVTTFTHAHDGALTLVEHGREADTLVR